jgi:nicotinamidase/pyrazinamidase
MADDVTPAPSEVATSERPIPFSPTTALIVVDVQNDFADPNGSLYVADGETILGTINRLAAAAISAGSSVVLTQDWHPESTPHFIDDGGVWPVHCVRDTWGAQLHPDLLVSGPVVRKGMNGEDGYSGFTMRDPIDGVTIPTELDTMLREANITSTVIVGIALDVCVRATAEDALVNGYEVTVVSDATKAVNLQPGDGAAALDAMRATGITVV